MSDLQDRLNELYRTLRSFEEAGKTEDVRKQVLSLIPAFDALRDVGKVIVPQSASASARDRLLKYFQCYPGVVISGKELMVVAGISEWARRVRELRVQFGWKIITGLTISQMSSADEIDDVQLFDRHLSANDYVLVDTKQDKTSALRWNVANVIRKSPGGSKAHILSYLRQNVGEQVTGEELLYVANDKSEWARRVRELRTEDGWPITTKQTGNPGLPVGVYVLEKDRQTPAHDRRISDPIRRETLRRDRYTCQSCGWTHSLWNPSDARFLELHHEKHHVDGGSNETDNLITLCNVCHDEVHRKTKKP